MKLIILITSFILLFSCSSKPKEKELSGYFCNKNLERYFGGNDSLPIINLKPNDSFGVIRKSVDSLYRFIDIDNDYPSLRIPITLDSTARKYYVETKFFDYYPIESNGINCYRRSNILKILLTSKNQLLVKNKLFEVDSIKNLVFKFITNYGKEPNYSDIPDKAIISLQKDIVANSKLYYQVIKVILDGYSYVLNLESKNRYKKSICELNSLQVDTISEIYPFNFYIEYPETKPYLPPPPIIEDEFISDEQE